jgi:hypothetical protein
MPQPSARILWSQENGHPPQKLWQYIKSPACGKTPRIRPAALPRRPGSPRGVMHNNQLSKKRKSALSRD